MFHIFTYQNSFTETRAHKKKVQSLFAKIKNKVDRKKMSLTSIRFQDDIDVYVIQTDTKLVHYWIGPRTNWKFQKEVLCDGATGKPAVIRSQNHIDIYFCQGKQLIHMWVGESTKWIYRNEVIATQVDSNCSPAAVRWEQDIDVYFVRNGNTLVHLHASPHTRSSETRPNPSENWFYEEEIVSLACLEIGISNLSNLTAIRNEGERIDIFFAMSETLIHGYVGDFNKWSKMMFKIPDIDQ